MVRSEKQTKRQEGRQHTRTITVSDVDDYDKIPVQLEFNIDIRTEPEKVVRPEYNVGKMANYIFANPHSKSLTETRTYSFDIDYKGEKVDGKLSIIPARDYQTPTTTTLRVFYGLIQLWEQRYRKMVDETPQENLDPAQLRSIMFSTNQLCKQIGWSNSGENFEAVRTHLDILSKTAIDWQTLFQTEEKLVNVVKDMRLVQANNYVEEKNLFDGSKFAKNHEILLSDLVVEGMIKKHVRPFNFRAYKSIRNPSAASLYAQLDFRLSKRNTYTRSGKGLIFDDLQLEGQHFKHKSRRKYYLEKLQKELDGKEIGVSDKNPTYLNISIEQTVDGEDWKLIARKISENAILSDDQPKPKRGFVRPLRTKREATEIASQILVRIHSHPKSGRIKIEDLMGICMYTPTDILYTCLTDVISEYPHGHNIKKSLSALYFFSVKDQMTKRGLPYPK